MATHSKAAETAKDLSASGAYSSLSVEDHIREKDMWAGTTEPIATTMIVFHADPKGDPAPEEGDETQTGLSAQSVTVQLSPALFKCVDEPIVNALDHAQRESKKPMTAVRIDFDEETGRISVANNGDGIPVVKRESDGMYVPQFVFSVPFSGSNMKHDSNSTLGGTNGIGVKITNLHSREFHVETHDAINGLSFSQTWTDGMRKCSDPEITKIKKGSSGTRVSFLLNYEECKTVPSEFMPVVFTRVIWAAFYLSQVLPKVSIYWNGTKISYSLEQYTSAIFGSRAKSKSAEADTSASAPAASMPAQSGPRVMIDRTRDAIIIASPDVKRYSMSVINGIVVPSGNHLEFVFDSIKDATKESLMKKLRATDTKSIPGIRTIANRLAIIVLWRATGVHWSSQSKDRAQFRPADMRRALAVSDVFTNSLAEILSDAVMANIDSARGCSRTVEGKKPKIAIDKYSPAHLCGTRRSAECRLFLAEGNSAMTQVCSGISGLLGFDLYGVLSLRGVIPNVRKSSIEHTDVMTGEVRFKRSQKLLDNKFIETLVQVLGIDFTKHYATPGERKTLRYGGIIGCVDQDLDGIGNIFSLVLNLFHLYWPALLENGYIQRLATPIIRAYPKSRRGNRAAKSGGTAVAYEFYSDEEYRKWADDQTPDSIAKFKIRYYKGLGKHNPTEMKQIMKNLDTQIITYQKDDLADETFEIYLGCDPSLRKAQLSQPPPEADDDIESELADSHCMPSSYHLMREAHTYQLDNLHRKINHVIGGTNQVSCKILNGCIKIFAQSREERKVADLAGTISTSENYHHGEDSLQDAIIRRGFIAPGGNQLPMLLPIGNFGTRLEGGQDAASARYIGAEFNAQINDALYQSEDYALLDFHVDEGKRGEPKFFVPIIPTAITENISVPAHGWVIGIWAREVMDVIANVRNLITSNGIINPRRMRPCCYPLGPIAALPAIPAWDECERIICDCTGRDREDETDGVKYMWHGYIVERAYGCHPETWSLGTYEWISSDTVSITELPLCAWSKTYMKEIDKLSSRENSFIKDYRFEPSDTKIDIQITFNTESPVFISFDINADSDALSSARVNDPVLVALHLRDKMCDNLNFMMPNDSVHTFDSYESIISYWFPVRREYYARRIARQREVLAMWILYYENIIKYIRSARGEDKLSIAKMTTEEAEQALAAAHFIPLDIAALESPEIKFEVNVQAKILGPRASFTYILNLRERDITTDGCAKFETSLATKQKQLDTLNKSAEIGPDAPFVGAKIWLSELDTLVERINVGRSTEWQYGDFGRFTFA